MIVPKSSKNGNFFVDVTSIGGIAMLTRLFLFCGTYTDLQQLYSVAMNPILKTSEFYYSDSFNSKMTV